MGKYFGTDGFRGEANVDLTVGDAFKVGRFLGWYYGRKHPSFLRIVLCILSASRMSESVIKMPQ